VTALPSTESGNFQCPGGDYLRRAPEPQPVRAPVSVQAMSRRPLRALAVVGLLATSAVVLSATPAFAHAQLTSTEPVGGQSGPAPKRIVLHFSESVEISLGSIRVFDGDAKRVTTQAAVHPGGDSRAVSVDLPTLERGGYVVTWRVISADSHPVHGAFTVRVGPALVGAGDEALARKLLAGEGGSAVVGGIYAVIRFSAFAALLLLVGGLAFLLLVWPGGAGVGRARRLLWGAWTAAVVATALGIPAQGAYAGGLPLSDMFSPSVVSGVLDTRFGRVWAARLVLLALTAIVLAGIRRAGGSVTPSPSGAEEPRPRRLPVPLAGAVGVLGAALLLTPGLAGHAASQDLVPLAVVSDLVHLSAVSLWLGGLAFLAACVLPRRLPAELATVVPKFSRLAFAAVIVILVTGTFQGWREVRSTAALTSTTYGKLLLVKVALFAALVGLGALSRRWVHARYRVPAVRLSPGPGAAPFDADGGTVDRLRRSVGAETVLAIAVLAVTSLLVSAEPARSALARPFSTEMKTDTVLIDVTVDPAKAGPADFHFYTLTPAGGPQPVEEFTADLRLPDRDVGPLPIPVKRAGPNHFSSYGFEIPLRGKWQLDVTARLTEIDSASASTAVPVR
jgi:copper transport protein